MVAKRRFKPNVWEAMDAWQRGRCYLCGRLMRPVCTRSDTSAKHAAIKPTVDHIHPRRHDGKNNKGNLALAHWTCNQRKGRLLPTPCQRLFGELLAECVFHGRPCVRQPAIEGTVMQYGSEEKGRSQMLATQQGAVAQSAAAPLR